jgi:hypothetical protein
MSVPTAKKSASGPGRKKVVQSYRVRRMASLVSLRVTMVTTFFIFLKAWFTAFIQGYKSGKAGERTEEDLKFYGHTETDRLAGVDPQLHEDAVRWRRIVQCVVWIFHLFSTRNNVENLPVAVALAIIAGICCQTDTQQYVHLGAYIAYAGSRTAWTIAYAKSSQPARSIFFLLGIVSEIVMGINGIVAVFDGTV